MGSAELNLRARARLGTTLRGKYRLDAVLGVGGMAVVYKATHRNRAEFAVKMLLPELSIDEEIRARFLREGYAANSVKHPGVVAVVDDDIAEDGAAFVVMELLDGMAVDELAARHGERLPLQVVSAIGCQLLDVIASAHERGILHRDIKPANLFVTRSGQIKVLDFGIARVRDLASSGARATQSGMSFGTPAFMPPEQARGKTKEIDERSDVWAIGATLFTLITGSLVHQGENSAEVVVKAATEPPRRIRTLAPHMLPPIEAVVDRALSFKPQDRWASAAEMRDALIAAHAACYRAPPSPADIAAFLAGTPMAAQAPAVADTRKAQGAEESSVAATVAAGGTTVVPVEANEPRGERKRSIVVAAISGGGVLVVGAILLFMYARHGEVPSPTTASPPRDSAPQVAPPPPPPPPSPSAATPLAEAAAPVAIPDAPQDKPHANAVPAATLTHHATVKPPSSAKADCNPNYTLDKDGNKHFKPECF